jgi:hypothetical protein
MERILLLFYSLYNQPILSSPLSASLFPLYLATNRGASRRLTIGYIPIFLYLLREDARPRLGLLLHLSLLILYREDSLPNWWRLRWESDGIVLFFASGGGWKGGVLVVG